MLMPAESVKAPPKPKMVWYSMWWSRITVTSAPACTHDKESNLANTEVVCIHSWEESVVVQFAPISLTKSHTHTLDTSYSMHIPEFGALSTAEMF